MNNWNHFRTRTRYETEPERISREKREKEKANNPAFLKPGYKILTDASPELKWWDPIFARLEMEEAELDQLTHDDDPAFQHVTQEQVNELSKRTQQKKTVCTVIEVQSDPYEARGYWFVPVYYSEFTVMANLWIDEVRQCDLMFNNRIEAMSVRSGSTFDKTEQDLD